MVTDLVPRGSQPYLGTNGLGRAGLRTSPEWATRRQMLTPHYTTRWEHLPIARAA